MATAEKVKLYNLRLDQLVMTNIGGLDDITTIKGDPGADGFSPKVELQQTSNGYKLGILSAQDAAWTYATLSNGHHGTNGRDGTPGSNGANAFTPNITVNETDNAYKMDIDYSIVQSKPPASSVTWYKGRNGVDGADGFTPVLTSINNVVDGIPTVKVKYSYQNKNGNPPGAGEFVLSAVIGEGGGLDLSAVMEYFGKVSIVKPQNDDGRAIQLSAIFYEDAACQTSAFAIDTATPSGRSCAYAFVGGNNDTAAWMSLTATRFDIGLGPEYDNYPILLDLRQFISDQQIVEKLIEKKHLYAKYAWYWKDDSDNIHYSDEFSLVFPSTSEVGASARSKAESKKLNTIEAVDSRYGMYVVYPGMPNVFDPTACTLTSDTEILLGDYSTECQYKIQFTVGSNPIDLSFYVLDVNGAWFLSNELNLNVKQALKSYSRSRATIENVQFAANTKYIISIELGMVTQIASTPTT